MSEPVGALRVELSANHAEFASNMQKAQRAAENSAKGMAAAMNKVKDSFSDTITKINQFGGMAALAAGTGFAMFIKKSIDTADELSKMSQKVGVSTEALSTLKYAAELSDVSLEALGKGFVKLSKNAADAANGTGEAKDTFSALGIALKNDQGNLRSSEELLKDLANKFKALPDGVEKTNAAVQVFGRAGADLIPMLNMGAAGIEQLQQRAKELGLELSTEAGRAAEDFNDQLKDLTSNAAGFGRSIATKILPHLNEYLKIIRMAYDEGGALHALWVSMGALGDALFVPGLDKKIKDLQKAIDTPRYDPTTGYMQNVDDLKKEMDALIKQRQALIDAAEQERAARRKNEAEEKAAQESNAAALRKTLETQNAKKAAAIKAEKDASDAHKLAVDLYIKDEADKWAKLDEWNENYIKEQLKNAEISKSIQDDFAKNGRSVFESVMTPMERYADKLAELDGLLMMGSISYETYSRAATQAWDDLQQGLEKTEDKFADLKKAIDGWGKDSAKAIVDFAMTGKASFSDMINSMISDILRMLVYQQITGPVSSWVGTAASSALKWALSAKGNVFSGGNLVPFAKGGIVTGPTIFPMANGAGLMGEAGPEAVMPLARTAGGELGIKTSGAGSGEYHTHVHLTVNALDSKSVTQTLSQHQLQIVGIVNQAYNKMGKRGPLNT